MPDLLRYFRLRGPAPRGQEHRKPSRAGKGPEPARYRPTLENLEDRVVMSAALPAPAASPALMALVTPTAAHHQAPTLLPITINSVTDVNGSLMANASVGAIHFQVPLTVGLTGGASASAAAGPHANAATPILDLTLKPIHLDLLGLTIDTSEIRLQITAQTGSGNLLGNLLTDVANLLNGSITPAQLTTLTTDLTNVLNGAFSRLMTPANAASGATVSSSGTTNILHLSVGPLNLNVLGLQVTLDNGSGGPVTVDIGAQTGPGNLLGNLVGNLGNLLNIHHTLGGVVSTLNRIAGQITSLINQPSLVPISINSISTANGGLVANASAGGMSFQIPLTLQLANATAAAAMKASPQATTTPILDLILQPIHLDLLGLTVDTSEIRLEINAISGPGNLLGNLLTDIANALNGGTSLTSILAGLTSTQLTTLTTGLTNLINEALGFLTAPATAAPGISTTSSRSSEILHLSVGPLNVNLLGLQVLLDNGSGGPITVDVGTQTGRGNLLGNLLDGLTHLLDNGAALGAVTGILDRIANQITSLINQPSLLPISVNSVSTANGGLVANASVGGSNFQIPLSLALPTTVAGAAKARGQASRTTPILDLILQPIHLNVLGLTIDTSEIRLEINAISGPGNLLGNLLTDIANLLNGGSSLSSILAGLTQSQLTTLTTGLTNLLNELFATLTAPITAARGVSVTSSGSTEILHLSVGPLNLNLLGLQVILDNGSGGPVTVDIGTQTGPGNLLGNLLSGLTHLLNGGAPTSTIVRSLDRIAAELTSIL
jgi:hypothetical protein